MKSISLFFVILCVCVLAAACQKSYLYEAKIVNKTTHSVTFLFYNDAQVLTDSLAVQPSSEFVIASETQDGEPNPASCVAKALGTKGDVLRVRVDSINSGKTLIKDLQTENKWINTQDDKQNTYNCSFVIENADIQ
jgi:hypothetical protein